MQGKIFYGWWVVAACFPIGLYASGIVFYGFTAFFEPFVREFGWSYTEISFAASLRGLEAGIFSPLIGLLADRFGSRKLILSGTIISGIALFFLSLTHSLAMFYCVFFLLAFGTSGCMGLVTTTAVANWFEKDVGKAFGVMSSAFGASGLIIPLIVWLTDAYHWRTALVILGAGMWTLGIPLSFVIKDRPGAEKKSRFLAAPDNAGMDLIGGRQRQGSSLGEALKNRTFLCVVIVEIVRMISVSAVVTHIMPYLSRTGMSRGSAGIVAAVVPLLSIIGRFGFGWLIDVCDLKRVLIWAYAFLASGMIAFLFVENLWVIPIFLFLFSAGLGGGIVLRGAILKNYFGTRVFGRLLGITMGSASIGVIIGPTMAGWFFDRTGDYRPAWLVLSGLLVFCLVMITKLKPKAETSEDR